MGARRWNKERAMPSWARDGDGESIVAERDREGGLEELEEEGWSHGWWEDEDGECVGGEDGWVEFWVLSLTNQSTQVSIEGSLIPPHLRQATTTPSKSSSKPRIPSRLSQSSFRSTSPESSDVEMQVEQLRSEEAEETPRKEKKSKKRKSRGDNETESGKKKKRRRKEEDGDGEGKASAKKVRFSSVDSS
ncbi:hypothetical protein BT69DRAFT_1276658 [Atractiella rhizophila]|nr:hypothetical protein BT69DRAFT_1276658 [Atractiella rhizophila]